MSRYSQLLIEIKKCTFSYSKTTDSKGQQQDYLNNGDQAKMIDHRQIITHKPEKTINHKIARYLHRKDQ